jgi:hypothetical protein
MEGGNRLYAGSFWHQVRKKPELWVDKSTSNIAMNFLPLPSTVYKYRSAESALRILNEQAIYLPSVSKFNDPFDCRIPMRFESLADNEDLQRKFIEKFLVEPNIEPSEKNLKIENILASGRIKNKEILRKMEEGRLKKMEDVFVVFCLSVVPDNLLMWAHYGNCHTGVCIGFNPKKLIEAIGPTWVAPVNYSLEYPQISVLEHPEKMLEILLFNKSIDWRYEKEIRYVKNWEDGDCKIQIGADVIEEICLGCMATQETLTKVTQIRNERYPQAKIIRYKKDDLTFKLQRE